MAGDWIKMRSDLGMDPAVIRMSLQTSLDPFAVVGRLHALWAWADAHTTNGLVSGVTSEWIDTFVRCPGFAEAMCGAGWLSQRPGGVEFPRFDRHMGDGAKSRAQKAKRQKRWRDDDATPPKPRRRVRVGAAVDARVDGGASTAAPPEKRRSEKRTEENPPSPPVGGDGETPPTPGKPSRQRSPLFDVVVEVTGADPVVTGSHVGKLAAALGKAEPPYTPDEVREFARRLGEFCSWAAREGRGRPTIGEIEKHIGLVRAGRGTVAPPAAKADLTERQRQFDAIVRAEKEQKERDRLARTNHRLPGGSHGIG